MAAKSLAFWTSSETRPLVREVVLFSPSPLVGEVCFFLPPPLWGGAGVGAREFLPPPQGGREILGTRSPREEGNTGHPLTQGGREILRACPKSGVFRGKWLQN